MEESTTRKYTDAQKKANLKYRTNNQDKIRDQRKKYYINRKTNDPDFLKYKREKAKEYYLRKKTSSIEKPLEEVITEEPTKVEVIEEIIEVLPIEESKKKRKSKNKKI